MDSVPHRPAREVRLGVWVAAEGAWVVCATLRDDDRHDEVAARRLGNQARRALGVGLVRPDQVREAVVRALLPRTAVIVP